MIKINKLPKQKVQALNSFTSQSFNKQAETDTTNTVMTTINSTHIYVK